MNTKVGSQGINWYFEYRSAKGEFGKVVFTEMFEDACRDLLLTVKRTAGMHDLDLERKFEVLLCKLVLLTEEWREANGMFRRYKEKRAIRKLDDVMNGIFKIYFRILAELYM